MWTVAYLKDVIVLLKQLDFDPADTDTITVSPR